MNDPYMQGGDDLSDPISLSGVSPMRYMANGGFVVPPQLPVVYRPEDREYLEARQAEAEAYDAQRTAYNAALEKYKTEVYNPYESQLNAFNAAAEAYNRDVYGPYQAAYKTYEEAVNAFNAGPMDSEYAGPAEPTLTPFSMTAPVAPAAFSMTAPTVPFKEEDVAARQAQAAEAARQDAESRQFAFEAINDPGQYNLAGMSQGSGIAGLSVPGYVKGGPVFAKAPGVLSAKQMLRKLGNKTKKFADGGAVTSPTLAEQIAAGAAGSVIAATPSVYSGTRPITALPVVPGSAPALQKPISTTAPAPTSASTPGSAKSDLAEILEPDEERFTRPPTTKPPELIYIGPEERPDYQPPGTKPPATQSPPLMGALPIKEFMPPVATTQPVTQQPPAAKEPTYAPLQEGDFGWEEAQNNAKRVLQMAVKRTEPNMMWDANGDGRISAADALQVAKGWRPTGPLPPVGTTQPVTPQPVVTSPKTYPPEFVGPLPEGAKREPSTMPNVPGIPDFPPVITPPGGNVTILPRPGLPPGTSVGPMPPGQSLPPVSPTPPRTPVTPQPVVPVPQMPTMPRTPPLFSPPPPGSMPGTLPMPFNPFQISQGPTAQDLLQQSPNLSPNILGGQGNLGFMKDRLGNVIRAPGAVRGFADGGEVEDEEPILTDPVGTASQMLRELNPQTQMEYEATPKKVSMKRISKTPMESASGSAKGMKMELEEISAMKMPKDAKRRGSLSKAEFEDLAREYGLKRAAALDTAKGLMRATFEKPTLEKPSLTKGSLSVKRFEKGGLVEKIGQWLVENDIHPTDFLAALGRIGSAASLALTPRELNAGESEALARLRKMTATTDSPASATDLPAAFAGGGEVKKSGAKEDKEPGLFGVSSYATRKAEEMFPNQMGQDDQRDAARHMLAAGLVARQYGPRAAELLGKAHEYTSNPHTFFSALGIGEARDDLPYDLHNNRIGIELASRAKSRAELEELVRSMARQSSFEQKAGVPWIMGPEAIRRQKDRAAQRAKLIEEGSQY